MQTEEIIFSSNIEVIRDIATCLETKYLANIDGDFRWAMSKDHHILIEITHHTSENYKLIILDFCGDGVIRAHGVDHSGNDLGVEVFDTHWYGEDGVKPAFRQFLLNNYQYYLL